jgi:hypothetical protein
MVMTAETTVAPNGSEPSVKSLTGVGAGPARPKATRAWWIEALECGLLVAVGLGTALAAWVLEAGHAHLPVLRTLAVVVLAFIPGWLYVRFAAHRAAAVWDEYVLYLHRLRIDDPGNLPEPLPSSAYHAEWARKGGARGGKSADNIYCKKFEAYYGRGTARTRSGAQAHGRARADTLFPMVLTTLMLAVGWAAVLSGSPLASSKSLATVLRFGFMGAYSFVLQMLVRRFFQSDLRPGAYVSASVRVVTVLILVTVVYQVTSMLDAGTQAAVAFVVGFFPLMGMQAIHRVAALALKATVRSLDVPYPLSDLDGLNIWNEARLLEEGIEDLQNLTTANLVDVMLHTRVPVGRLMDWIDQAYLFLHLEPCHCSSAEERKVCSRETLRRFGIRTATDLEDVFSPCPRPRPCSGGGAGGPGAGAEPDEDDQLVQSLGWVLNDKASGQPSMSRAILKTFGGEPNLEHVRCWKRSWRPPAAAG